MNSLASTIVDAMAGRALTIVNITLRDLVKGRPRESSGKNVSPPHLVYNIFGQIIGLTTLSLLYQGSLTM